MMAQCLMPFNVCGNKCNRDEIRKQLHLLGLQHVSQYFTELIYLQDMGVEICGIKFYGTPWVSAVENAAFHCPRSKIMDKWNQIPRGIDILISHMPPLGHGDFNFSSGHIGDVDLFGTVACRLGPRFHIFGHNREGYVISDFDNKLFISVTQFGKIGSLVIVRRDVNLAEDSTPVYSVKSLLGKDQAEYHFFARHLYESLHLKKQLLFGFALKSFAKSDLELVKKFIQTHMKDISCSEP
ncbi:unnamed protein product [Didymodactylos carnosus]|uniref:Uncharacterized protein n=1 Tax=Didymodactylos carnosus TaxID=1234261 RepID=A0A814BMN5_9BILA|nr:unnamed protein product [Didymodactylos carnosus]CAF3708018.1 unnamed protein product [Didymodactylos carnosus]